MKRVVLLPVLLCPLLMMGEPVRDFGSTLTIATFVKPGGLVSTWIFGPWFAPGIP